MADVSQNEDKLNRIRKMQMLRDGNPRLDTPKNLVRKAVERRYPRISAEESRMIVYELVSKPNNVKLKIGNEEIRIDDLSEYVADNIELINAGSSDYGSSSEGEYFGWIDEAQSVIGNMNDGEVTVQDLDDKHDLLKNFQQREVDLMTCISLYQRCNLENPEVKKKYDFLRLKLLRLREIRSAVENSTKDRVDEKERSENENNFTADFAKTQVYLHYLTLLSSEVKENRQIVSEEDRRRLNVYNTAYVNTAYVLENIGRVSEPGEIYRESLAEQLVMKKEEKQPQSRESIEQKLLALSGRKAPLRKEPEYDYDKTRARAFDMNRYLMLKKAQERGALQA